MATLLVAALLVLAPMVGAVGAVTAATAQSPETYNATDNVDVWENSPLPFRLDTDDAAKTVTNGGMFVELTERATGPVPIRKSELGVYSTGTTIDATFESVTGAGTSAFNGNDTQLVIARLEANTSTPMTALPSSLGDAREMLTQENANQNATFRVKDTGNITSDSLSTTVNFDKAGTYALFLATGSAFNATDGNLSVNSSEQATIVGMDAALVEDTPADVTVGSQYVDPGDNATFTVNTDATDTNVSVLLYNTSTVQNSETTFKVTEPVDSSLNASDITIEHSIAELNGVAKLEGPTTILGTTIGDSWISGSVSVAGTIEVLVDAANTQDEVNQSTGEPNTTATGNEVLDASVVAATDVDGTTQIEVPTFGNWSQGDYTYIVVAGGTNNADIHTATGEINVTTEDAPTEPGDGDEEEPPTDGGQPPAGGGGQGGGAFPPTDGGPTDGGEGTPTVEGAAPGSSVQKQTNGRVSISLSGTNPGQQVRIQVPVSEEDLERDGFGVSGMRLDFTRNVSGTIDVSPVTTPDAPPVSSNGDLGYFEITHSVSNDDVSGATYEFSVNKQRLEQRGMSANDVALYRYQNSSWQELDTRQIGETATSVQYEADSPGLSLYAISTRSAQTQDQADIQVTDAAVTPTEVSVGDSVEVTATVENQGSASGEFTAELEVDGTVVDSTTVEVAGGEQTTVEFSTSFAEAGDFTVSVNGVEAGTVTVTEGDTGGGGGGLGPIVWVVIAIVIIAAAVVAYLYREGYFEGTAE